MASTKAQAPAMAARAAAQKAGELFYIGDPCGKCGGTKRYSASCNCVPCKLEQATKYQKKKQRAAKKHK